MGDSWFDGDVDIEVSIDAVRRSLDDPATHFAGVVARMPGMLDVELLAHDDDGVTIRTNEGTMRRGGISVSDDDGAIVIEFDESYDAGRVVGTSHFRDRYEAAAPGTVRYQTTVSDVQANGLLGFFYRRFGARNMGKAFLSSQKAYLESLD